MKILTRKSLYIPVITAWVVNSCIYVIFICWHVYQIFFFIIAESEGRDLSAIISSLVQLLLDHQARTMRGFHCLIQKEWVALGHPFSSRLGHTRNDVEEQVRYVFMLILTPFFDIYTFPLCLLKGCVDNRKQKTLYKFRIHLHYGWEYKSSLHVHHIASLSGSMYSKNAGSSFILSHAAIISE